MTKIVLRNGIFETNSSGAHGFIYLTDKEIEDFLQGKFYIQLHESDGKEAKKITPEQRWKLEEGLADELEGDASYTPRTIPAVFPDLCNVLLGDKMEEEQRSTSFGCWRKWHGGVSATDSYGSTGTSMRMEIEEKPKDLSPDVPKRIECWLYGY